MQIVKTDRRYRMYDQGFTYQIKYFDYSERTEICKFFQDRYGPSLIYNWGEDGTYQGKTFNDNWRYEIKDRSGRKRARIYVKHDHDLVLLGLVFSGRLVSPNHF